MKTEPNPTAQLVPLLSLALEKRRSRRRRGSSTSPVVQLRRSSISPVVPPVEPPCAPQPFSCCPCTPRYQARGAAVALVTMGCAAVVLLEVSCTCTTPLSPPATSLLLVLSNPLINLPIVMLPLSFFLDIQDDL